MGHPKIATCCYCGTRAALVLRGDVRHELACAACGAPLHNLKSLPVDHVRRTSRGGVPPTAKPARPPKAGRRKRKSLSRRVLSDVIDLIEDIFD